MKYLFICYPKCSTCRKAQQWLDEHHVAYEQRHIVENRPTEEELSEWISRSRLSPRCFFNTSGLVYRSLQLKDKLPKLSEIEQIKLLASDGKLIKRPLLISEQKVLVGFNPVVWSNELR